MQDPWSDVQSLRHMRGLKTLPACGFTQRCSRSAQRVFALVQASLSAVKWPLWGSSSADSDEGPSQLDMYGGCRIAGTQDVASSWSCMSLHAGTPASTHAAAAQGVWACLDLDVLLTEAQHMPLGGAQLLLDQINASDHLCHWMLHLPAATQPSDKFYIVASSCWRHG